MTHVLSEAERRAIQQALRDEGAGVWTKLSSEIDFARNQVYFWFMIDGAAQLERSLAVALKILHESALEKQGVEFNASFIEINPEFEIEWETLDDDEIRQGRIARTAGGDPMRRKRKEYSVFDLDT